jgi:type VI secretion system (T6SS) phospholipase Tle1-like effector
MPARRIILLLDGTWNDADFETNDTNIVRLRDIIARSLGSADPQSPEAQSPQCVVATPKYRGIEHVVFYQRGVGTGVALNRLLGGIGGDGLDVNIRRAYKFLSFNYQADDQIFIFGFSRGSFTARSLVGYIAAAGLLRADRCTEENERAAWDYYRAPPSERVPGVWHELTKHVHNRSRLRIECIGVFDTVGALGIPVWWLDRANREQYEFHNVELSSITNTNLHALAIDEHRWPFQASLWRKPPFNVLKTVTEQVWFSGAHGDVGGGAVDARFRKPDRRELDDITLDWMIKRLTCHYPKFPVSAWTPLKDDNTAYLATQNQPRKSQYRLYPYAWRAIANIEVKLIGMRSFFSTCVSFDRHDVPIDEMIHISAIKRLGCSVSLDGREIRYCPRNLVDLLPMLYSVYRRRREDGQIRIVDWDGRILRSKDIKDRAKAVCAIRRANLRLARPPK